MHPTSLILCLILHECDPVPLQFVGELILNGRDPAELSISIAKTQSEISQVLWKIAHIVNVQKSSLMA
jgi:hypothetical protein